MARRGRLLPALIAALASGCLDALTLPQERSVDGVLLHPGRDLENPSFVLVDGKPWVMFEARTAAPVPPRAGSYDLWMVPWEEGSARRLVENAADRDSWPARLDASEVRYLMTDERVTEGAPPTGGVPHGTLVRFHPARGVLERIPEVVSYTVSERLAPWLYRRLAPGSRLPTLHFRSARGVDRALGPSAGAAQIFGDEKLYFVAGEERTLSRITAIDGPVEPIRSHVTRYMLRDDEELAILSVSEMGRTQAVVRDLKTGLERRLPGQNPCCWIYFAGPMFVYSEAAGGGANGKLHLFNVETDQDRVIELPPGLADVTAIVGRPQSDQALFFDSRGRVALFQPPEAVRVLELRPMSPQFTADGRYLLYIDPQPQAPVPEGRLMAQDADFREPPRTLSPPGTLVPQNGYFLLPDGGRQLLVFWAHFGRGAADLYFADHETGEARVVAEAISEVTVTPRRVTGIVRVSQQDLVGDLVHKDLSTGDEQILAHRVSDAAFFGPRVAFVVRERIRTRNDGLWATCLAPDEEARRRCVGRRP